MNPQYFVKQPDGSFAEADPQPLICRLGVMHIRRTLEIARHELVVMDGLTAADGAAPSETFTINTRHAVQEIDEVINELCTQHSLRRECVFLDKNPSTQQP